MTNTKADGTEFTQDNDALEAHCGTPAKAARPKVARRMTPARRARIAWSRSFVLSMVGPEGAFDAKAYDKDRPGRAAQSLW